MNYNRRIFRLAATAAAALLAAAVASAQAHEHGQMQGQTQGKEQVIKAGKKGEIVLSQDTRVGDLTLKAGTYQVQHRVDADGHFVHFTEMSKTTPYSRGAYPKSHAGEIKCRVEPLDKKVPGTAVYISDEDGTRRVTRIEIAGENVAHLF